MMFADAGVPSPDDTADRPTSSGPPLTFDCDDDDEARCLICGGEGYQYGEDMGDPLWYDPDEIVTCTSCGGSGLRKDMTWC